MFFFLLSSDLPGDYMGLAIEEFAYFARLLPVGTRPRLQAPAINDDMEPLSRPAPLPAY